MGFLYFVSQIVSHFCLELKYKSCVRTRNFYTYGIILFATEIYVCILIQETKTQKSWYFYLTYCGFCVYIYEVWVKRLK